MTDISMPTPLDECALLCDFKDFLTKMERKSDGNKIAETEVTHNYSKRINKDTYLVSSNEKEAEVMFTLWSNLEARRCPKKFQTKLLHAAKSQIEHELRNSKECEVDTSADEQPQWDLSKLQKFVTDKLDTILIELSDNAARSQLKYYADSDSLCLNQCKCSIEQFYSTYAVGCWQNNLRKMEDRHVCLENFSTFYKIPPGFSFYGVFDGHGGVRCASYTASQLPYLLANQLLQQVDQLANVDFYRHAFEYAFLKTDENFTHKRIISGTTAVCALLTTQPFRRLYVAWVGDSKASLFSHDQIVSLVKPHKPESDDEHKRIIDAGGSVISMEKQYRVNGILNVSRSIGDYNITPVIAKPDFKNIELTSSHDFLILGSDGLWDHIKKHIVKGIVYNALCDPNQKFEDIPNLLIKEAYSNGNSRDNITAVIVLLKKRSDIVESYRTYQQ